MVRITRPFSRKHYSRNICVCLIFRVPGYSLFEPIRVGHWFEVLHHPPRPQPREVCQRLSENAGNERTIIICSNSVVGRESVRCVRNVSSSIRLSSFNQFSLVKRYPWCER